MATRLGHNLRSKCASCGLFLLIAAGFASSAGRPEMLTSDEVQRRAAHVLDDPIFAPAARNNVDHLIRPLIELLRHFGRWLQQALGGSTPLSVSASITRLVLVVLILAAMVAAISALLKYRFKPSRRPVDAGGDLPLSTAASPVQWIDEAKRLAVDGDYRNAVRAAYVATLILLDRQQRLRYVPEQTNWQHIRSLAARGQDMLVERLSPLTASFDRIWYGEHPSSHAEYLRFEATYDWVASVEGVA